MSIAQDRLITKAVTDTDVRPDRPRTASAPSLLIQVGKWLVAGIVLVLVLDTAASLLIGRVSVRRRLDARLAAAFGRPVQVDSYSFSLWGGPTLEAAGVIVGEDPRFGYEYFLRADDLGARLRLGALLRGRLELGTLTLTGPTLNVEENAAHDWNVAEWLGRPVGVQNGIEPRQNAASVLRLRKIQLDGGRINFKRDNDKLPFAFVNVTGSLESDAAGRWRVDLETSPWRAAAILQQAGTIHLAGTIGGTSSALRPADLQISWADASVSDFLRLVRGDDRGIRGTLAIQVNAHAAADGWQISGGAQAGSLHRWDLAARPDNPSLNVTGNVELDLTNSRLTITRGRVDAPRSNAQLQGQFSWGSLVSNELDPHAKPNQSSNSPALEVTSSTIDMSDVLSWLRAFHAGVPDDLLFHGNANAEAGLSTGPLRLVDVSGSSFGMDISGGPIRDPIHLGQLHVNYDQGILALAPTSVVVSGDGGGAGRATGTFVVEIASPAQKRGRIATQAGLHVTGSSSDAASLVAAANALGWNPLNGWSVHGRLSCDLMWPPKQWPWQGPPNGTVVVGGTGADSASMRVPFLNLPITALDARIDSRGGVRHVAVNSAELFGSRWSGNLQRTNSDPEWQFTVAAGRVDAADLDRWLNPKWRESLIDRMLPFLNSSPVSTGAPASLHANGRLNLDAFVIAPFTMRRVQASIKIEGQHLNVASAAGNILGGRVSGVLDATLGSRPAYSVHATLSGAELAASSQGSETQRSPFGGAASGEITLWMQGASRQDLLGSLRCNGSLDVRNASWNGIALGESLEAVAPVAGISSFNDASGRFTCGDSVVTLSDVALVSEAAKIGASGTVDYSKNVNLQFRVVPAAADNGHAEVAAGDRSARTSVLMTGSLEAPEFRLASPGRRPR